ncbi:Response regulator receiver domain-containing protein [Desulfacinum hydrothermale DSM 13146]|uniref:Response regulator receiver domain-containing protein n=1 Tax=Desulfacinum hydrothermale DSM 13146 TaxID=1121390 RepID=A0A1W1X4N3_9BACT|nr:response regulator [Desulfacinum hydrothermale]SMC18862.1 Response regulator receiver domain-containing protein [Desulfacinum hydrothermale DSM 13146]
MSIVSALVIDDEKVVCDSVSAILAEGNFKVDVSLNSREGLEKALRDNYDVILTDIMMPEIDGMDVLRDIKSSKPHVPVLMITGYGSVQSAVEAMRLGAADYIEKPFDPEQLLGAVQAVLGRRDLPAAQATQAVRQSTPGMDAQEETLVHRDAILRVLERAVQDPDFNAALLYGQSRALDGYELNAAERYALVTGDLHWLQEQLGFLDTHHYNWLMTRLGAEIW